jgi:hypothetical protein
MHKGLGKGKATNFGSQLATAGKGRSQDHSLLVQMANLSAQYTQPNYWEQGSTKGKGKGTSQQPAGRSSPSPASLSDFWPSAKEGLKDPKGNALTMVHPKHPSMTTSVLWICTPASGGCGQFHCSWAKKWCASCNRKRPPQEDTLTVPPKLAKPANQTPGEPSARRVSLKPVKEADSAMQDAEQNPEEELDDKESVAIAPMLKVARHCKLLASLGVPQAVAAAKTQGFNIHLPQKEESARITELTEAVVLLEHVTKLGNLDCIKQ